MPASTDPHQSGTPGGRSKDEKELREQCRGAADKAFAALLAALETPRERVAAATVLLAYGYGRPVQTLRVIRSFGDLDEEELRAGMANDDVPSVH
jgi:hypothetical protein